MRSLDDFISGLPKAELHIHIEGSLEPQHMFALAARNKVDLPYKSVDQVKAAYEFANLQDFLDLYYAGASVLQKAQDFHELMLSYLVRLHRDGGLHAEIFFDPQTHTSRGVPFEAVMEGLTAAMEKAERDFDMTSKLIMCFLRHLDQADAMTTLRKADKWMDSLAGVGLDSSEQGHPPSKFAQVFAAAGERGLKRVVHAGEEGPPDYVWQALDLLKADRIDHGNRALEDPRLVERLARDRTTLTVCPLSNLKLRVVGAMTDHPLKRMLDLGLKPTVNSDDPAYFGGYLNDNYRAAASALGLSRDDLVILARNSFTGSFLAPEDVAERLADIEAYVASFEADV